MSKKRRTQPKVTLAVLMLIDTNGDSKPIKFKGHPRNVKKRAEIAKIQEGASDA